MIITIITYSISIKVGILQLINFTSLPIIVFIIIKLITDSNRNG